MECVGAIELALDRGDRTIVSALSGVRQVIIPLETVEAYGDPELLFLNVNRPPDRERAETLLAELAQQDSSTASSFRLDFAGEASLSERLGRVLFGHRRQLSAN